MEPPAAGAADDADVSAENPVQTPEVACSAAQPSACQSEPPVWTAAPEDGSSGWCRRIPASSKLLLLREGKEEIEIPGTPPKAAPSKAPPPSPKATVAVQNSKAAAPKPKPPPLSVGPAFVQEGAVVESQSQAHVRSSVGGLQTFTVTTTSIITTRLLVSELDVKLVVKRRRIENETL